MELARPHACAQHSVDGGLVLVVVVESSTAALQLLWSLLPLLVGAPMCVAVTK